MHPKSQQTNKQTPGYDILFSREESKDFFFLYLRAEVTVSPKEELFYLKKKIGVCGIRIESCSSAGV